MLNVIKNELYKMIKTKKIYVFMLIIFIYNFFPALEQVTGAIEEAGVIMNGQNTAFYMLDFMVTNILTVFVIVAMADMITGEYVNGTLKLPLLHPVSRTKLLAAKVITVAIATLFFLVFSMMISYGLGTAIFGWGDQFVYQMTDQSIHDATVYETSEGIIVTIASYLLSIFPLMAFSMVVLLLSLLFRSSGVTVGISVGMVIFLSITSQALEGLKDFLIIDSLSMFRIYFVTNDVSQLITSLGISGLYAVLFGLISHYIFKKKDLLH